MAPLASVAVQDQRSPHGQAHLEKDDPFRFNEQQLHYDGYDNEGQIGHSQWHAPHRKQYIKPFISQHIPAN